MTDQRRGHRLDITLYLDPSEYLRDLFASKNKEDPSLTVSRWSQELGIQSRSLLKLILQGRREIPDELVSTFISGLGLTEEEAGHFTKIFRLSQSRTVTQITETISQISETHSSREALAAREEFLSHPLTPKVMALLTLDGFEKTAENIARIMGADLHSVEKILQTLQSMGYAGPANSRNVWNTRFQNFFIKDGLNQSELKKFHRISLEEALSAIDLPVERRRYRSIFVPMTQEEFQNLNVELNFVLDSILARLGKSDGAGRRLYQVNCNIVSVSEEIAVSSPELSPTSPRHLIKA